MKKVSLMVSIFTILLLVLGTSVSAQNLGTVEFCGELSEADCDLLTSAQEASMNLTSASMEFDMNMSVSNIPDAPFDSLAFQLVGDGSFAYDPALQETMMAIQDNPAMFADPAESLALISEVIAGISGDLNLTLSIPPELAAMAGGATEQPIPENLSISLRLVDGFGYVNLDSIAAVLPPDAGVPSGWMGVDLAAVMDLAMEQAGGFNMESLDPAVFENYMNSFMDPELLAEFMTVERVEDTDVMGQSAAVFLFNFDYGKFFNSSSFQALMEAQMAAVGESMGEEMDPAEIEEVMSMMGPMVEDINLEIRYFVGLDDNFVHGINMNLDWDMAGFMMMVEPDAEGPAPVFAFDLTVDYSNFNDAPAITAPEDATIFPLEAMMSADT